MRGRSREIIAPYMGLVNNTTIHVLSRDCVGPEIHSMTSLGLGESTWTANLVVYVPFITYAPLVVAQFMWLNGSAISGNTDVGIYSEDGQTKFGSTGATANAGSDGVFQKVNVTDFFLPPNQRLWLAFGCDNATQRFYRTTLAAEAIDLVGVKQQPAGYSGGLPATATFSVPTVAFTPMFGFTGQAVI